MYAKKIVYIFKFWLKQNLFSKILAKIFLEKFPLSKNIFSLVFRLKEHIRFSKNIIIIMMMFYLGLNI